MSRGSLSFKQQSLNKLSLNSGKDGVMLLHKKSKGKTNSNSAGTYSANNDVQKIKFIQTSHIEG